MRLNLVSVAVIASKSSALPAIETIAYKDEEVIYLNIDAWIRKQKLKKTLIDSGAIVKLINQKMVHDQDFLVHWIDEK